MTTRTLKTHYYGLGMLLATSSVFNLIIVSTCFVR
jgi:hypothetical protein